MKTQLRIAVCEDRPADAALLVSYIKQSSLTINYDVFTSGHDLLANFKFGYYDAIFLDIYLLGSNGVETATVIRTIDADVALIFTTTSPDYALEGYRLGAIRYLEKPVTAQAVLEALDLMMTSRRLSSLKLLIEGKPCEFAFKEILFFEQCNYDILVHTVTGKLRLSRSVKLTTLEPSLPSFFLRCHHSFIVNLHHVRSLDQKLKVFIMQGGTRVYIRHRDFKAVEAAFANHLFALTRASL